MTDAHRIMMTRHVCYRHWHHDPAAAWWRVWVVMPNAESAFGTGATVREAYYMAESTARRCRPRPFLPQRYEWANKKRGYGLSMDLTAVVRNLKRRQAVAGPQAGDSEVAGSDPAQEQVEK